MQRMELLSYDNRENRIPINWRHHRVRWKPSCPPRRYLALDQRGNRAPRQVLPDEGQSQEQQPSGIEVPPRGFPLFLFIYFVVCTGIQCVQCSPMTSLCQTCVRPLCQIWGGTATTTSFFYLAFHLFLHCSCPFFSRLFVHLFFFLLFFFLLIYFLSVVVIVAFLG